MTGMQSFESSGLRTLRLISETICWRIKYTAWLLLDLIPRPSLPKRIKEMIPPHECLAAEIEAARLARLRAEAKLAATVRQSAEVRRAVSDWSS